MKRGTAMILGAASVAASMAFGGSLALANCPVLKSDATLVVRAPGCAVSCRVPINNRRIA